MEGLVSSRLVLRKNQREKRDEQGCDQLLYPLLHSYWLIYEPITAGLSTCFLSLHIRYYPSIPRLQPNAVMPTYQRCQRYLPCTA
ncbi:hypothetical protein E2C01_091183 [Portunus trituberculatus]|uniref:Uncharacterized protein n=1 Tax=Portunus trituberculatus TaxID=210409 RepID=A0A5B7JNC8_PORTR|nr:hypothetical protein [Portunus trituberculatus]